MTRRTLAIKSAALAMGFILAAISTIVAIALAGGGHGWNGPFFHSLILFVIYPLVFERLTVSDGRNVKVGAALLAIAVVADILLTYGTYATEYGYFMAVLRMGPLFVAGWLGLWLFWQLLAATLIIRNSKDAVSRTK